MARQRLRNERWGFDSNCFVCEPKNAAGMQLPFEHDDELDAVVCEFTLDGRFSGAPKLVHGGVLLSILDEAMAWATIAIAGRFAVTEETTSRFKRPVKLDRAHRCEARVASFEGDRITTTGVILDRFDQVCVESEATFRVLMEAQALDVIGELTEEERGFLSSP
jgi:acyl-coenzyme A thioesterase PaaI-like protein